MLVSAAAAVGVSTGNSITGTMVTVPVPGLCPVPGPGVTAGGADSGGPAGVATVGICPVVPGPAGTGVGLGTAGPGMLFVAILSSFSCDTDIYP